MTTNNKTEEKGFFYRLTGMFVSDIEHGTKGVDKAIEHSLLKVHRTLEMEIPFPNLIETQGNIFEYEDFSESALDSSVKYATERLLNSNL